ncbi:MAG TPA: hypothetical protein VN873_02155 [Candidatus Angelobacter sp.]|nr:hypothetical protein [Candidatus Angelobacter sp.]
MSREFRHQASLLLNLILVIVVLVLVRHKSERAPATIVREVAPARITNEAPVITEQPKLPQYTDIASAPDRRRWLVDQLRAAGVPNDVVARVVMADLDDYWQKRIDEGALKSHGDPDTMAALHLEEEKDTDAQMRAALGDAGFRLWDQKNMLHEANIGRVPLTGSEADSIYDMKKKLQQTQWDLEQARIDGDMDDAEIDDATTKAYSEFNQQMKTLLGDDRYAQSQGVDPGAAAANLRQDLAKANPSDAQFQQILTAQQQLDDRRSQLDKQFQDDPSSPDYAAQIKALNDARDQEYQRVLGTNVFDALQKGQDIGYTEMKKYENIWGLDDGKIDYVYGAMKYYEKSAQDYEAAAKTLESQGQTVDWDAVNKNLQQFAQQTQQSLQTYLGQDSFNEMQRNGILQFSLSPQRGQIH